MTRVLGKLIGALLGLWLLRHPLGALLGAAIGHAFDAGWLTARRAAPPPPAPPPTSRSDPAYAVLGVDARADDARIAQAYRQLMRRFHPDKVAQDGPEARAAAEARAREINAAYDRIRELRKGRG